MPDNVQKSKARRRLYMEPRVQVLLSALMMGKVDEIMPRVDEGGVQRFHSVEKLLEASPEDIQSLLNRLTNERILVRGLHQSLISCPSCKDPTNVFVRHLCPICGSSNLAIEKLVKHLSCGHETRIKSRENTPTACEKCNAALVGDGDYLLLATSFLCKDCGKTSGEVIQTHFCSSCKSEFSMGSAIYLDVYSYRLRKGMLQEIQQSIILPMLTRVLSEMGFQVQTPGYLTVASGSTYSFSLAGRRGDLTVAIDIIQAEGRVTLPSILPTLSKMTEHRPICVFLIAVPSIDRKAQETAEAHGIVCIHGTVQDICEKGAEKLRQGVGEVLSRINSGNEER